MRKQYGGSNRKRKKYCVAGRLFDYLRSHMWSSFAAVIVTALLLLLLLLMYYMKGQYYQFLLDTTYATEETLMDTVMENLQNTLSGYIRIGANICVDNDILNDTKLRNTIDEYVESQRGALDKQRLKNALKITGNISNAIIGVAVANEEGILYQYDKYEVSATTRTDIWNSQKEAQDIFAGMQKINQGDLIPRYLILTEPSEHPNVAGKKIVSIAFPFRTGYSYRNIPYILLLTFTLDPMEEILNQLTSERMDYVQGFVQDETGRLILRSTSQQENAGQKEKADVSLLKATGSYTDLSAKIGKYGWELHAVIDENGIMKKVDASYGPVLSMYFGVILIIFGLLIFACSRTLRPVSMIGASMAKVRNGQIRETIPILGTNEIWQLAESYNQMLEAINRANEEVESQHEQAIENMRMKRRAEREALESQINAHFICNTLNAINYEAIEGGNYKVSVLLKKLSNILRYTFDQKHQNVYMRQEIVWIEQYLYLQKERLEEVFDYEISFDPDYDNWPCRKLMLQPFVENSISHGFEGRREGGRIRIVGEGYREFLKITIEDNGCGMDPERSQVIQEILEQPRIAAEKGMGIGISNVITRMRMYYGKQFQAEFDTEEGCGTRFTFILPMPQTEDVGGRKE